MQKIFSKKDIYSSLFLAILLINISSITVVSVFNYFMFHRRSEDAYLSSFVRYNQRVTDLAFNNMDKQIIQSALHISQFYFSPIAENAPFLWFQEKEGAVSAEEIRAFTAQMNHLKRRYPYISSIDIYYEGTGTVVTGFDKIHYPESQERLSLYLPWHTVWQEGGARRGFLPEPVRAYAVEEPVITYVERVTHPKWEGRAIVLAVHLSPSAFGEYIDEGAGSLTVMTKEGQVLYDTGAGASQLPSAAEVLGWMEQEGISFLGDNLPFSMNTGEERITVFHTAAEDSGLTYLYRIADRGFYAEYNVTKRMFIMSFVLSIGFNIIMLLVVSYYNYLAYRKRVRDVSKGAGIDLLQEDKSFDGSLRLLTKEITSLHETVNSSKGLIFQSAVRSILLNKNQESAYREAEAYLTGDEACTFFFYLSEKDARQLSVEGLQEEYKPGSRPYNVLFTTLEKDGLVALLICGADSGQESRKAFMSEMDERLEKYSAVSGQAMPTAKDGITASYKSAAEAAGYRYIMAEEKWITYESIRIEARKGNGSHLKLFEMMEKDMRSENLLDFKARLEGLVVSFKSGNYTMNYCNSTLRDLVTLFYQLMQQNRLDMWVLFGYDIREHYKQIRDIEEFHQWANELCEIILRGIRQKKQSVDPDIRRRMEELIEENLEGGLSLDLLSDELHMRPDVVSRMFRQMMGKGYSEYVKERKLNRAIELMGEGYSIKDTAEQLGYSSAQYFIRVFKENYGVTPYQYKKNQEKGQESHDK